MIIIGCRNSAKLAKRIAKHLKCGFSELKNTNFPDSESYLRFAIDVKNKNVVLVNSMHPDPNTALVELIFASRTAQDLGAKSITLIIPYLGYMRQDEAFNKGECVSSKYLGELLSCADRIITIDPHLHRHKSLDEVFRTKTKRLSANSLISGYIKKNLPNAIIIGPDAESYQWAEHIAEKLDHHAIILKKKRLSSTSVKIKVKQEINWKGKDVVIVDDIISTGHTMIEPIRQLKMKNVRRIHCICVHGIFALNAVEMLKKLGARVACTNTIERKESKIDVSKLIADELVYGFAKF